MVNAEITRDKTHEYGSVDIIPRKEFVKEFGNEYGSGQHVTTLGPTGKGKTVLVKQLLVVCASPERKAVVLHGKIKGKDHVVKDGDLLFAEAVGAVDE